MRNTSRALRDDASVLAAKTQRRVPSTGIGTGFAAIDVHAGHTMWRCVADRLRAWVPSLAELPDIGEHDPLP